jgi:hypothetical protein
MEIVILLFIELSNQDKNKDKWLYIFNKSYYSNKQIYE